MWAERRQEISEKTFRYVEVKLREYSPITTYRPTCFSNLRLSIVMTACHFTVWQMENHNVFYLYIVQQELNRILMWDLFELVPSNQQLNFSYYITAYAQIPTEAVFMMRKGKLQIQDGHVGDRTSFSAQLPE